MTRIPGRWRLGILLAAVVDVAAAVAAVSDSERARSARYAFDPLPSIALAAFPWGVLMLLRLIGWTWQGFVQATGQPLLTAGGIADQVKAIGLLLAWLEDEVYAGRISGIGHRVVHGGSRFVGLCVSRG